MHSLLRRRRAHLHKIWQNDKVSGRQADALVGRRENVPIKPCTSTLESGRNAGM